LSANKSTDLSDAVFVSACQKVTSAEYEQQKMATQSALADLLDSLVHNENISEKEKKAKLKMVSFPMCMCKTAMGLHPWVDSEYVLSLFPSIQFSKQYPEIYAARFGSASVKH